MITTQLYPTVQEWIRDNVTPSLSHLHAFGSPVYLHVDWGMCKLNNGLKQAPLAWNQTIDEHLHASGFQVLLSDLCVYVKGQGWDILIF